MLSLAESNPSPHITFPVCIFKNTMGGHLGFKGASRKTRLVLNRFFSVPFRSLGTERVRVCRWTLASPFPMSEACMLPGCHFHSCPVLYI